MSVLVTQFSATGAALTLPWPRRFGLADVRVLRALEALPGVAALEGYLFVEERGPWDMEAKRLEKELEKRDKAKPRARPCIKVLLLVKWLGMLADGVRVGCAQSGKGALRSKKEGAATKRKPEEAAAPAAIKCGARLQAAGMPCGCTAGGHDMGLK